MSFKASMISALQIGLLVVLADATIEEQRRAATAHLPLTTVFIPPADCFTDVSLLSGYGYPTSYSVGLGPGNEFSDCTPCWLGLASTSTCFPSGWSQSAVFSPGVCPDGYYAACSSINSIGTLSETVATCCPRCVAFRLAPHALANYRAAVTSAELNQ
jgi:hypothetical protein